MTLGTKELILKRALSIYNHKGINISSRYIAAEVGISAGNLHYHFKHTIDIIEKLCEQLYQEFDDLILWLNSGEIVNLQRFILFIEQSCTVVYKYRFILINFVEINFRIPKVGKKYKELVKLREEQFIVIFNQLVISDVFKGNWPEEIFKMLVKHIFIVSDFWVHNNILIYNYKGKEAVKKYSRIYLALFYPYMTEMAQTYVLDLIKD